MTPEDLAQARRMDADDPLAHLRRRFEFPRGPGGSPQLYFCGNSLGLMPRSARELVDQELEDWSRLAVAGHFRRQAPWFSYHETVRDALARVVGALPEEVVAMNSLTVNLHLMLASFYQPAGRRRKILVDAPLFPSDLYAVHSHLALRGGAEPEHLLLQIEPRPGEDTLREEDIEAALEREGQDIALVLLSGVNYHTGQALDLGRMVHAAHRAGSRIGFDLAHAAGNIPLALHDWEADFAVWCSYKYLNAGPGAVAGCFVHRKHGRNRDLPRLAGWWGHDPDTRFQMDRATTFVPQAGAEGWQLSNPPILALAPLRASLQLFEEAGMAALRRKSEQLTGWLASRLEPLATRGLEIITPADAAARGCQLSLRLAGRAEAIHQRLEQQGIVGDFRPPDVLRVAPVPLYNSFEEVCGLAGALARELGAA